MAMSGAVARETSIIAQPAMPARGAENAATAQTGILSYIAPLTGLRALAALLVLLLHIKTDLPSALSDYLPFINRGWLGVDVFFVLSGFVLAHVYGRFLATPCLADVRIFFWHRFVRIYPVHIALLGALVVMVLVGRAAGISFNHPEGWTLAGLVRSALLLQIWSADKISGFANNGWNGPSWSISAEAFAYLMLPVIAPVLMLIRRPIVAFAVAAAALGVMIAIFKVAQWPMYSGVGISAALRVSCEFICGAALSRAADFSAKSARTPYLLGDIVGICGLVLFLIGASVRFSTLLTIPFIAMMIWGAATARGPLARSLGSRPLIWLGDISYSIYMVHMPALLVIVRAWQHLGYAGWPQPMRLVAIAITAGIVIGLAATIYYAIEWPLRTRWRDTFGKLGAHVP
jgi:peptidoglycan/LPS O-acetylase OafA/YrhL